jgi:hypothetical protein
MAAELRNFRETLERDHLVYVSFDELGMFLLLPARPPRGRVSSSIVMKFFRLSAPTA